MKVMNRILAAATLIVAPAGAVPAAGASQHLSNGLAHSLEAVAQSTVGGFKLVSGAVAVPLMFVGEIGKVSGAAGDELWRDANTPIGTPLLITDEVITAGPTPAEALQDDAAEPPR